MPKKWSWATRNFVTKYGAGGRLSGKPSATAAEALRIAKRLQATKEKRIIQITTTDAAVTSTAATVHLTAIAGGSDDTTRTGDKVNVHAIHVRGILTGNASATKSQHCRIIVVKNNQQVLDTDAAMNQGFSFANIYGNALSEGGFKNQTVLYDKVHTVSAPTLEGDSKYIDFKVPLKYAVQVRYNGNTAADISSNGLYMYTVGDEATNGPSWTGYANVVWSD